MWIQRLVTPILALCLIAQISFAIFYCFVTYQSLFHSDTAAATLLAQEIVRTGSFFPKQWYYANQEVWVLNAHLLVLPFLALGMKGGYLVHALGGLLNILIGLGACFLFCRAFHFKLAPTLLFSLIMMNGFSDFGAGHIHGERTYAVFLWSQLVILACLMKMNEFLGQQNPVKGLLKQWELWVFVVLVFLMHLGGLRGVLSVSAPLFCALLSIALLGQSFSARRKALVLSAITGIGSLLGLVSYRYILGSRLHLVEGIPYQFVSAEAAFRNFLAQVSGLLEFEGIIPAAGVRIFSEAGILVICRAIVAVIFLGMVFSLLRRERRKDLWNYDHLLILFALAGFLISGYLAVLAVGNTSFRYLLVPTLLLSSTYPLLWNRVEASGSKKQTLYQGGAILCAIVLVWSSYLYLVKPGRRLLAHQESSELMRLASDLERRELHFGYATFWNAGAVSVLSNFQVFTAAVHLDKQKPVPAYWLSSKYWYQSDFHKGKTFMLLKDGEASAIDRSLWMKNLGNPKTIDRLGSYEVWVYDENPVSALKWD